MSLSLQSSLGALLLNVLPKNEAGKPISPRDAWSVTLDHLPAGAFDPTQPILPGGEPWLFLLLKKMGAYGDPSLDFLVERYGNSIMACRNRAGQTLIEKVFEACVEANETEKSHNTMATQTLAQVMRLSPLDLLRTSADRDDGPGTGWLERLAQLKDHNVNKHGEPISRPEHVLIMRGANPNRIMTNGQPVANLLMRDFQVKAYLDGGLDLSQAAHHPLFPGASVGDLLRGRSKDIDDLLGPVTSDTTVEVTKEPPPEEDPHIKRLIEPGYGRQKVSKDGVLLHLDEIEAWEQRETLQGTPVVWKAISASDAALTELKKPKQAAQLATAIQRTDSQGRSPWFHYLLELDGRAGKHITNEANLMHVESLMPPLDDSVVVKGQGLYEQIVRHTWQGGRKEHASLYAVTPHPGRAGRGFFGEGGTEASPLDHPLMMVTHDQWWGTLEAQQQFARDLLIRLAQVITKDPLQGKVELPNLKEVMGQSDALHPELVGVLGVVNFVNRTAHVGGNLGSPILPFKETRLENYPHPLAVTQSDVMGILRPLVAKRIEEKRLKVEDPGYEVKETQRRVLMEKAERARQHWAQTAIVWKDYSAQCLAVGPQEPSARPRRRPRT